MPSSRTDALRNGRGSSLWRRRVATAKRQALTDLLAGNPWHCTCGTPLDPREPAFTPLAVEADHPTALKDGGTNHQQPILMHRHCNNSKNHETPVNLRDAT